MAEVHVKELLQIALLRRDLDRLLQLCRLLDLEENLTVSVVVEHEDIPLVKMSLTHHVACIPGSLECLQVLVEKFSSDCLTCTNQLGDTPVHYAAWRHDEESMKFIHRILGSDCFKVLGERQQTAVHYAALNEYGNSALKWLVRELGPGCLTTRDKDGDTAIHLAAYSQGSDSMELVKREFKASFFHLRGAHGRGVLHCAALNETSDDALKWLVEECGSVKYLVAEDDDGDTPMHLAAFCQGPDSMELMKEALGASCFLQPGQHGRTAIHCAAMNKISKETFKWLVNECGSECLIVKDSNGDTPVHLAAMFHGPDSMDFVKNKLGTSCFHERGQFGHTVIHTAATNCSGNYTLKWLVKEFGPQCLTVKDTGGDIAVHLAAQRQGLDSMEFIKKNLGVSCFHQIGELGRTVIHSAALNEFSNDALLWLIKECGPECLSVKDEAGNTPVHLAAQNQTAESLQFVADQIGTHVFWVKGSKDKTVTHRAARNTESKTALTWCITNLGPICLLDKDSAGRTPAHLAARYQGLGIARLIAKSLGISAFTLLKDTDGKTLKSYAALNSENKAVLKWIVRKLKLQQSAPEQQRHQDEQKLQQLMMKSQRQSLRTDEAAGLSSQSSATEKPKLSEQSHSMISVCSPPPHESSETAALGAEVQLTGSSVCRDDKLKVCSDASTTTQDMNYGNPVHADFLGLIHEELRSIRAMAGADSEAIITKLTDIAESSQSGPATDREDGGQERLMKRHQSDSPSQLFEGQKQPCLFYSIPDGDHSKHSEETGQQ